MTDKIPLNDVLNAIDKRDFGWYSRLPDEQKKKWSSWLFIRYASSVKGLVRNSFMNGLNRQHIYKEKR